MCFESSEDEVHFPMVREQTGKIHLHQIRVRTIQNRNSRKPNKGLAPRLQFLVLLKSDKSKQRQT